MQQYGVVWYGGTSPDPGDLVLVTGSADSVRRSQPTDSGLKTAGYLTGGCFVRPPVRVCSSNCLHY